MIAWVLINTSQYFTNTPMPILIFKATIGINVFECYVEIVSLNIKLSRNRNGILSDYIVNARQDIDMPVVIV